MKKNTANKNVATRPITSRQLDASELKVTKGGVITDRDTGRSRGYGSITFP